MIMTTMATALIQCVTRTQAGCTTAPAGGAATVAVAVSTVMARLSGTIPNSNHGVVPRHDACYRRAQHRCVMDMTKTTAGNFFEDFRVGAPIRHPTPRTVTDGDVAL